MDHLRHHEIAEGHADGLEQCTGRFLQTVPIDLAACAATAVQQHRVFVGAEVCFHSNGADRKRQSLQPELPADRLHGGGDRLEPAPVALSIAAQASNTQAGYAPSQAASSYIPPGRVVHRMVGATHPVIR